MVPPGSADSEAWVDVTDVPAATDVPTASDDPHASDDPPTTDPTDPR